MAQKKTDQRTGQSRRKPGTQKGQPLVAMEVHLPLDLVELLRDAAFARFVRQDLGEHSVSRIIADILEAHRARLEAEGKMTRPLSTPAAKVRRRPKG